VHGRDDGDGGGEARALELWLQRGKLQFEQHGRCLFEFRRVFGFECEFRFRKLDRHERIGFGFEQFERWLEFGFEQFEFRFDQRERYEFQRRRLELQRERFRWRQLELQRERFKQFKQFRLLQLLVFR